MGSAERIQHLKAVTHDFKSQLSCFSPLWPWLAAQPSQALFPSLVLDCVLHMKDEGLFFLFLKNMAEKQYF